MLSIATLNGGTAFVGTMHGTGTMRRKKKW